jgi:hypothetical protein
MGSGLGSLRLKRERLQTETENRLQKRWNIV